MSRAARWRPRGPEAKLAYEAGFYRILRPGDWVSCAETGAAIPLGELRYWSAEHGEAYVDATAATRAWERRQGTAAPPEQLIEDVDARAKTRL